MLLFIRKGEKTSKLENGGEEKSRFLSVSLKSSQTVNAKMAFTILSIEETEGIQCLVALTRRRDDSSSDKIRLCSGSAEDLVNEQGALIKEADGVGVGVQRVGEVAFAPGPDS